MTTTPTLDQLKRGLAISEQIAALESEMAAIFNGAAPAPTSKATAAPAQGDGRKAKRSAATIAKMKAAAKARWAKVKAPAAAKTDAPVKKKGGMSAAGKAKIAAAQKARWAKIKAEKAPVASGAPAVAKAKADAPAKKRTISPEARAKIAAAQKARWAAVKKK